MAVHARDLGPGHAPDETRRVQCHVHRHLLLDPALEPEEDKFDFSWLDAIMDKLAANNAFAVLATPSAPSRRGWPEVPRDAADQRSAASARCGAAGTITASLRPIYREKVSIINTKLAERDKDHPALLLWHISNEYGGECHCPLCQDAFRGWLKQRYNNDLDALNLAWWSGFWSHTITAGSQIESPCRRGDRNVMHGHTIDWMRFVTDQTIDFYKHEIAPLKQFTPECAVHDEPHGASILGWTTGSSPRRWMWWLGQLPGVSRPAGRLERRGDGFVHP